MSTLGTIRLLFSLEGLGQHLKLKNHPGISLLELPAHSFVVIALKYLPILPAFGLSTS